MPNKIVSAKALDKNRIQVEFKTEDYSFDAHDVVVAGLDRIVDIRAEKNLVHLETSDLSITRNYVLSIRDYGKLPVDLSAMFENLSSDKPLGFSVQNGTTAFRLFAPRASSVELVLFKTHNSEKGAEHTMTLVDDGVWEVALTGTYWGQYYGYRVAGPQDSFEKFNPQEVIADPYSRAVVSQNTFRHDARSIVLKTDEYDWEGDAPQKIPHQDLIIYEMHVRDMTVHPSAKVAARGTYTGLVEKGTRGGINHVLELGANAVELLPVQDFGNFEIPYKVDVNGVTNTWNPYSRNHWGYMTSYFFAPEPYYASGGNAVPDEYLGINGQQVDEFKDMVKAFHREGIAVILDVVYNHVSQYDLNPLKYTDKQYFFKLNPRMKFLDAGTGCGNELRTERPMARRMIIESVKYWMQEYHIDGFRFDLAAVIDWQTIEDIREEAKKINPDVILIAEPWGLNSYSPAGFSERGWAAWNDVFRNGIKGQNPHDGLGFIFGKYWSDFNIDTIRRFVSGSPKKLGGQFVDKRHSVNYLESHDDLTLGDFIRIGSREVNPDKKIVDVDKNAALTKTQLQLNKLAAVLLTTSQGPMMVHAGQEFARSKVIAPTEVPESAVGHIDHNSYNKDNETNWLNFEHKKLNRELFDYYRGLIALRKGHPALRNTDPDRIEFLNEPVQFSIGFLLPRMASGDSHDLVVLVNTNQAESATFHLPEGAWRRVVDAKRAGAKPFGKNVQGSIRVSRRSALILLSHK